MPVRKGERIDPAGTRQRVLETAGTLFYDRGTHPVGVNEIAEAAGVSKLTLYRHFESKEGLIRAFLDSRSVSTLDALEDWAGRHDLDPDQRVLGVFDGLRQEFRAEDYRGCALMNTAVEWRGSDSEAGALARRHIARIRAVFERLCEEARIVDPAAAAGRLTLLLEGAVAMRVLGAAEDPARDARETARALLAQLPRRA